MLQGYALHWGVEVRFSPNLDEIMGIGNDKQTLNPGEDYTLTARFSVGGGGQTSNIVIGQYISDSIPAPGFNTQAVTIVKPIAVPKMSFSEPIQVAPNTDAVLNGVVSNAGTADFTIGSVSDAMWFRLPTGWTRTGTWTMTRNDGTNATLTCSGGITGNPIVLCDPPADVDDILASSSRNIRIQVRDVTGEVRGRPRNAMGCLIYSFVGATPPDGYLGWTSEGAITRDSVIVAFPETATPGTKVWFTAAWFNTKGTGPGCTPVASMIGVEGALAA